MSKIINRRTFWERYRYWILAALDVALLVWLSATPQEDLPVAPYKLSMPLLGFLGGLWFDKAIWPFAQPEGYLDEDWRHSHGNGSKGQPDYPWAPGCLTPFLVACLRQAVLVCTGALAVSLGL